MICRMLRVWVVATLIFCGSALAQGAADATAAASGAAKASSHKCNFHEPTRQGSQQAGDAPMNILLVGASGMIGSRVLNEAVSRGHCVIGASRNPGKIAKHSNVHAVQLDATDAKAFSALAAKADAIVTATSPRGGGDPMVEAKSVGDAAIAAAKASGKRLIVVGGAGSLNLPSGQPLAETLPAAYRGEALAMRAVLESLKKSDIDWTFFSPAAAIAPGKRTGKYQLGTTTLLSDAKGKSSISAEDYAHALVDELEKHAHSRQQMTIAY